MAEKIKRVNRCECLTMTAQIALLLAACVLASDYIVRAAYAGTLNGILVPTPNAAADATRAIPTAPKPADMLRSQEWAKRYLSRATDLPISFVLGDQPIHGIPQEWQPVVSKRRIDGNRSETIFEGTDPKTRLHVRVECTEYADYPVVEWVAWFNNEGHEATPIIRDILALDETFKGSKPVLYSNNGDFYSEKGYTSQKKGLGEGDSVSFAPHGGRPSDGAFPYYRLMFDNWGLSLAIGWPAQWAIHFDGLTNGVHVKAGQEKTNLRLGARLRIELKGVRA